MNSSRKISDKIKTREEIIKIIQDLRKNNTIIVTTNGAFDILHAGHVKSLEEAKSFGDILIVGLNSDGSIQRYKSKLRPIINQEHRAVMLAGLECVDFVVLFEEEDPCKLWAAVKPNIHVKSKTGFTGIEKEVIETNGGKIVLIDDIPGISTTNIINKIMDVCVKEKRV